MEKLVIEIETGNDAVSDRFDATKILQGYAECSMVEKDSGIIRDINGNKIGEWKWGPTSSEILEETFNRT